MTAELLIRLHIRFCLIVEKDRHVLYLHLHFLGASLHFFYMFMHHVFPQFVRKKSIRSCGVPGQRSINDINQVNGITATSTKLGN